MNLYNIGKVREYLTEDQAKTIVHAYVTSKLDGNNGLLAGSPSTLLSQVERVQKAAAKLIVGAKKFDHVPDILEKLHWLPVKDRILFKTLLLTYKALNNKGPAYLKDLFTFYRLPIATRSTSDPLRLDVPWTNLKTYGDRAFSVFAANEWNDIPLKIRQAKSVDSFKTGLKTHLFKKHCK